MKDITAILVHYSSQTGLDKALRSLKNIKSRLKSVTILQKQNMSISKIHNYDWIDQVDCITTESNLGGDLNNKINFIKTHYLLFLHDTDYLSPEIEADSLYLPHSKNVLVTSRQNKQIVIQNPLFIRTSYLKKQKLISDDHLPFKEALFPAWLSTVDYSLIHSKEGLLRQSKKNSSANIRNKQEVIQKYNGEKVKSDGPSLSVIISNYNMEKYVGTAIVSCLLQIEQPEQILIIDDGSRDNSYQQLQQWHDGKQVKVFKKRNEGKARALNDLLPYVTSDFTLELDADDWLDPDAVSVIKNQLSQLPEGISVLYGNLRKWKQLEQEVLFKGIAKGKSVNGKSSLMSYRFPLGPRIFRTSSLKGIGGFPVISFKDGRLYEDVSVLIRLIENSRFKYHDFTVYNVRKHKESITNNNLSNWSDFLKTLK